MAEIPHRARLDGRGPGPGRRAVGGADAARRAELPGLRRAISRDLIGALASVKGAAAVVNGKLGVLDPAMAEAIHDAAAEVARGDHDGQFPIDVFQTGSGTSSNMNANEVIARAGRPQARQAGAPERPRQRLAVLQRRVPHRDAPGCRPAAVAEPGACAVAPGRSAGGQGSRVRADGEERAHAPDGRDAGDAGAGVRRVCGRGPAGCRAGARVAWPGGRAAARRHRGGHRAERARRLRRRGHRAAGGRPRAPADRGAQPLRGGRARGTPWSRPAACCARSR